MKRRFSMLVPLFLFLLVSAPSKAQPVRGLAGDLWADLVLGQPTFGSLSLNQVTASGVLLPSGLAADPNPAHHRLYVWDDGNSRILGFSDTQVFSPNTNANQLGFTADIVLGQNSVTTCGCNGDNNNQNWPSFTPPTSTSLCGMWQRQGSILEGGSGSNMAVDPATGDLYVADIFNNRVLRFAYAILTSGAMGPAASNIWGQSTPNDFLANQGFAAPNSSTLFFGGTTVPVLVGSCSDAQGAEYGGVGIDSHGNLWVADTSNQRVLRFSADPANNNIPKSTADLVLGQSNFNGNTTGNLSYPLGVRVDASGNVYIIDNGGSSGRVVIFKASTISGQSAVAAPDGVFTSGLDGPLGIDLDSSNHLWVANTHNPFTQSTSGVGDVVMYQPDLSQATPTLNAVKVLEQDNLPPTPPTTTSGTGPDFSYANGAVGSSWAIHGVDGVALDGQGNVYISTKGASQNVYRFPAPIPTPQAGKGYSADVEIFKQNIFGMFNQIGWNGFNVPYGVAAAEANPSPQVIVADSFRLDYWNIPSGPQALSNYQVPDGYAGVNSTSVTLPGAGSNSFTRIRVDHSSGATGSQHLWAINGEQIAQVYNLPLANYASFNSSLNTNIPVLGAPASLIDWTGLGGLSGLNDLMPCGSVSAPYASGPVSYLWVADNNHGRVYRIRDPMGKLGLGPVVDILIGQTTAANNTCGNFGTGTGWTCNGAIAPNQYTLNMPGSLTLDHAGNLYVCDFSLETAGNWRLLEYDASEIEQAGQAAVSQNAIQFLSGAPYPGATHIYQKHGVFTGTCDPIVPPIDLCMPLQAAFPSADQALVVSGFERIPVVVPDPHTNFDPNNPSDPWTHLNDFDSNLYSTSFDDQDNLYTVDSNRARVLVYLKPLPTPTTSPTGTQTPAATQTPTISPTPLCYQIGVTLTPPTGGYSSPNGVAVDINNHYLYAADTGNKRVVVYTYTSGNTPQYLTTFSTGSYVPWNLCVDSQGYLYFSDYGDGILEKLSFNGSTASVLTTFGAGLIGDPRGLWVDPNGNSVYVVSQNDWGYVFQQGLPNAYSLAASFGGPGLLNVPSGVLKIGNTVYTSDTLGNRILGFPETPGTPPTYGAPTVENIGSAPLLNPYTLAADWAGNIYVDSGGNGQMLIFDKYFNWIYQVPGAAGAMSVDEKGNIFVATANQVVEVRGCTFEPTLTPTGTLPTMSPTPTATPSPTLTPSISPTSSWTPTATTTSTNTPTNSPTATTTNSPTQTSTSTPTVTPTQTATATPTSTFSLTPSPTSTFTITPTYSPTQTQTEGCHGAEFYPNPVRQGDWIHLHFSPCDQGQNFRVRIYTVSFRKVLDRSGLQVPLMGDYSLAPENNWGRSLANGLYYVVVESPQGRMVGKLLILK